MRAHPAWFQRHSESEHVAWHVMKMGFQLATVAFGCPNEPAHPLPHLMCFDWRIEGVLATLCLQVRVTCTGQVSIADALTFVGWVGLSGLGWVGLGGLGNAT